MNGYTWDKADIDMRWEELKARHIAARYAIPDAVIRDALTLVDMQEEMLDFEDLMDTQECARC